MAVRKPKRIPKTIRVPNPEYEKSVQAKENLLQSGYLPDDIYPDEYGKQLPPEGGWILTLTAVTAGRLTTDGAVQEISVPRFSFWYALPAPLENGLYKVVVLAPEGEIHVWAHEYTAIPDIETFLKYGEQDGFSTHFLNPEGGFDPQQLFYLRSRGLDQATAQRLLIPTLHDQHVCYFTLGEAYSDAFPEGTGMRPLSPENHARRAAAHRHREALAAAH